LQASGFRLRDGLRDLGVLFGVADRNSGDKRSGTLTGLRRIMASWLQYRATKIKNPCIHACKQACIHMYTEIVVLNIELNFIENIVQEFLQTPVSRKRSRENLNIVKKSCETK
jgi:hypothetical protein